MGRINVGNENSTPSRHRMRRLVERGELHALLHTNSAGNDVQPRDSVWAAVEQLREDGATRMSSWEPRR